MSVSQLDPVLLNMLRLANREAITWELKPSNFEVLRVKPWEEEPEYNTYVLLRIDKYPGTSLTLADKDRYIEHSVKVRRLNLTEAFHIAKVHNENQYVFYSPSITDAESICAGVRPLIHIDPNEVVFRDIRDGRVTLTAKPDSLGYTGSVTLKGGSIYPGPPLEEVQINVGEEYASGSIIRPALVYIPDEAIIPPGGPTWSLVGDPIIGVVIDPKTGVITTNRNVRDTEITVRVDVGNLFAEAPIRLKFEPDVGDILSFTLSGKDTIYPGESFKPVFHLTPENAVIPEGYPQWFLVGEDGNVTEVWVDPISGRVGAFANAKPQKVKLIARIVVRGLALEDSIEFSVIEKPPAPPLESFTILGETVLKPGSVMTPSVVLNPIEAEIPDGYPIWSIESFETIDGIWCDKSTGVITVSENAVNTTFTLVAKIADRFATLEIKVVLDDVENPELRTLVLIGPTTLKYGEARTYEVRWSDQNYVPESIVWSSDKSDINEEGLFTAIDPGNNRITVTVDGKQAFLNVVVPEPTIKIDQLDIEGPDEIENTKNATYKIKLLPLDYSPRYVGWWMVPNQNDIARLYGNSSTIYALSEDKEVTLFVRADTVTTSKKVKLVPLKLKKVSLVDPEDRPIEHEEVRKLDVFREPVGTPYLPQNPVWTVDDIDGVTIDPETGEFTVDAFVIKQPKFKVYLTFDALDGSDFRETVEYEMLVSERILDLVVELPPTVYRYSDTPIKVIPTPGFIIVKNVTYSVKPSSRDISVANGSLILEAPEFGEQITVTVQVDDMKASDTTVVIRPELTGVAVDLPSNLVAGDSYIAKPKAVPDDALLPNGEYTWSIDGEIPEGVTLNSETGEITTTKEHFGKTFKLVLTYKDQPYTASKLITIDERLLKELTLVKQKLVRDVPATMVLVTKPTDVEYLGGVWSLNPTTAGTVDQDTGIVTITNERLLEVEIKYVAPNGVTAMTTMDVVQPIKSIDVTASPAYLLNRTTTQLLYRINPSTAVDTKDGVWEIIEGNEYANLDGSMIVVGDAIGKDVVVRYTQGGVVGEQRFTIQPVPLTSITIQAPKTSIYRNEEIPLTLIFNPATASTTTGTWGFNLADGVTISKDNILKVTSDKVASLTVTYTVGNVVGSLTLAVVQQVDDLTLYTNPSPVTDNSTVSLGYGLIPSNAYDDGKGVWAIVSGQNYATLDVNRLTVTNAANQEIEVSYTLTGVTKKLKFTVQPVLATKVEIESYSLATMVHGKARDLALKFTPEQVSDKSGTWEVIPADAGTITGRTLTTTGNRNKLQVKFTHVSGLVATGEIDVIVPLETVTINVPSELDDFSTFTPTFDLVPPAATLDDPAVMRVEGTGRLEKTANAGEYYLNRYGDGNVLVTVEANGVGYFKVVKVNAILAETLEILHAPETLKYQDQVQLEVEYTPDPISDERPVWETDPSVVANIDQNGFLEVVNDATDEAIMVTAAMGGKVAEVLIPLKQSIDHNTAFTPTAINYRPLREELNRANLLPTTEKNPISQGFFINEAGYLAEVIYSLEERGKKMGYTYRIRSDVYNWLISNSESEDKILSVVYNDKTLSFSPKEILANTVVVNSRTYYFYVKEGLPHSTQTVHTVTKIPSITVDEDHPIDFTVIMLKPSQFTPIYFNDAQLQMLRDQNMIDAKMTGVPVNDIIGNDVLGFQLEMELPRRGSGDYAVYGLKFDQDTSIAIKQTALKNPRYQVLTTTGYVTAEDLIKGSLDTEDGLIYVKRIYRTNPELEQSTYLNDVDILHRKYDKFTVKVNAIRRIAGWKPGEGRLFEIMPIEPTDAIVNAAIAAKMISNNVSKGARLSYRHDESMFVTNAFYPTKEISRTVAVAYVVPTSTFDELTKLAAENEPFAGVQVKVGTSVTNYTPKNFLARLFNIGNTPFLVLTVPFSYTPVDVVVTLDFDGEDQYYYERFEATTRIIFDIAEPSRMTPVVPTIDLITQWEESGLASQYFNPKAVTTLSGTTYTVTFPYKETAQTGLLAYQMSQESYNKLLKVIESSNVMRITSVGISTMYVAKDVKERIFQSNGFYYFLDEAYSHVRSSVYDYAYDWDATEIVVEQGSTRVTVSAVVEAKPADPRIVSTMRAAAITPDVLSAAKVRGLIPADYDPNVRLTVVNTDALVTVTTAFPYSESPASGVFVLQVTKDALAAIRLREEALPNEVLMTTRKTVVNSEGEEQAVIREYTPTMLLNELVIVGAYGYLIFSMSRGEKLIDTYFDLDFDGREDNFKPNTMMLTHVTSMDAKPIPSLWTDGSAVQTTYQRHVAYIQGQFGGASRMATWDEFITNVTMTTNEAGTETSFVGESITDTNRYYAPVVLYLPTDAYNTIMALYNVSANRKRVVGTLFDSRTTLTTQYTVGQFVEQFAFNDTSNRFFFLNHAVNLGADTPEYQLIFEFDFDIDGIKYALGKHTVTISNKRITDFVKFISYKPA